MRSWVFLVITVWYLVLSEIRVIVQTQHLRRSKTKIAALQSPLLVFVVCNRPLGHVPLYSLNQPRHLQ